MCLAQLNDSHSQIRTGKVLSVSRYDSCSSWTSSS